MNPERWIWVLLLLPAWALRLSPALNIPLHPDEALYGYWGLLIGQGQDPWLAMVPAYKPPLLPYLMAATQTLFGRSEFAVRLVGLMPGMLTVPLAAALARALYRDRWIATVAAIGVAFSPLAISLSASAFLDPLMVALGVAACVTATRGRPGWAGVLAGLSFATKQTGLMWTPLAVLCAISKMAGGTSTGSQVRKFLSLDMLAVGLIFAWDAVRMTQGARSFWRTGIVGYGGLRLIWPHELWARLREWLDLARSLFASPVVNGTLLLGLLVMTWRALTRHRRTPEGFSDLLLISFSLIYLLLHWLWAFPVWDRYLLPLVPLLSILLGRIIRQSPPATLRGHPLRFAVIGNLLFAILLLLSPSISGDRTAYDGIDRVTAFLSDLPEGSVVYHHWLGWHYHFYLFDAPVYLAYWPTPAWLARDVQAFGTREPRYVTFPAWESSARVERALDEVDYELAPVLTTMRRDGTPSFIVYRVEHAFQDNSGS